MSFRRNVYYKYCKFYTKIIGKRLKKCGKGVMLIPKIFLRGEEYIEIKEGAYLDRGARIEAYSFHMRYRPSIIIGRNVQINPNCHIGAINKIIIKDNVLIGSNVLITDHFHGKIEEEDLRKVPAKRRLFSKGPVEIDENVWIGENVAVLPGIKVGKNAIIGANSVVTHDVPANAVVGGNPARVIKMLK